MKVVTVRDFRDRAGEMVRSDDVSLVTRDGALAGFRSPRPTTTTAPGCSGAHRRTRPRRRPTVALALILGLPIVWSRDKDPTGAGLDVYTTGDILDALRDAGRLD